MQRRHFYACVVLVVMVAMALANNESAQQ